MNEIRMNASARNAILLLVLALAVVGTLQGCGYLGLTVVGEPTAAPPPTVSASPTPRPSPTLVPTRTPRPSATPRPTTAAPTLTPTRVPDETLSSLADIPTEPNESFVVRVSQEDLNASLADEQFERDGLVIGDAEVTLLEDAMEGHFAVTHAQTGLGFGIIVQGEPHIVDGRFFFRVGDVSPDESVGGLTRVIVSAVLDQAVAQVSAEEGIEIPLEGLEHVEIREIEVEPGYLVIAGWTR